MEPSRAILPIETVIQNCGHCGPATVSMLLGFVGRTCDQSAIVEAAGLRSTIATHGSRIDQLAAAVESLDDFILLAKFDSTTQQIIRVISEVGIPVGVEWQSTFCRTDGTLYTEGHYSVVRGFDFERQELTIADPDPTSQFYAGSISFDEFARRWWEENQIFEPNYEKVLNRGLCFAIVQTHFQDSLLEMGFQQATQDLMIKTSHSAP